MAYLWHLGILAALAVILAESLKLLVGFAGLVSLSHAAFYGLGAYTTALLTLKAGWGFLPALGAAMLVCGPASLFVALPTLRLRGDSFVLATIGFQAIVYSLLSNWTSLTGGPFGLAGIPSPRILGRTIPAGDRARYFVLCAAAAGLVDLDFSDREPGEDLIDLEARERKYPGNRDRYEYVVIETGGSGGNPRTSAANKDYIRALEDRGRGRLIMKPLPGVYELWEKSGAWARCQANGREASYRYPFVPGTTAPVPTGHSAPGRLLEIADRLLMRARAIAGSADAVPEAVHGAVLALEAQELLGCQNPTTTLEALAIQHDLEVVAECKCLGVESSTTLGRRFKDIEAFVDATKAAFGEQNRDHAAVHARAGLINRLVPRFRDAARFDEENECLNQARLLSLGSSGPFRRPLRWYLYRSVGSLRFLIIATLLWVVGFSIAFYGLEVGRGGHAPDRMRWLQWLCYSALTMIGLGTPDMGVVFGTAPRPLWPTGILVTVVAATVVGFFHIGILVSAPYSRLARR